MRLETRPGEEKCIADCLTDEDPLPSPLPSSACGRTGASRWASSPLVLLPLVVAMVVGLV